MRKQYIYLINGKEMSRKEFMDRLRVDCQRVVKTGYYGYVGIDICEFDQKKFNHCVYEINRGVILLIGNKDYRRKEV